MKVTFIVKIKCLQLCPSNPSRGHISCPLQFGEKHEQHYKAAQGCKTHVLPPSLRPVMGAVLSSPARTRHLSYLQTEGRLI